MDFAVGMRSATADAFSSLQFPHCECNANPEYAINSMADGKKQCAVREEEETIGKINNVITSDGWDLFLQIITIMMLAIKFNLQFRWKKHAILMRSTRTLRRL